MSPEDADDGQTSTDQKEDQTSTDEDDAQTSTDQHGDVQEQLTEEQTRKELDEILESHAKLYQETHDLLQQKLQGLEDVSTERLIEQLKSVSLSWYSYENQSYNIQYLREYKKKAGTRMVQSGLVHGLCDAVLETAKNLRGDNGDSDNDLDALAESLDAMLSLLWNFTDENPSVCEAVRSHGELLPAFVVWLDDGCSRYAKGTLLVRKPHTLLGDDDDDDAILYSAVTPCYCSMIDVL